VALKAIEQNKNYLEHTLDFVLKLTGYRNNQSDLGQGSLTMFRLTTYRGASIKAVPFKSE
jgi:hypothetical protein